ncbi:UNVERIFIED_CONTAM: hypothetical protein Sradi_6600900 [Sesamum radiatum]|uniref:Uncharacterized protein n=1 Tax=Sesamum radiatum TaxID=300843 RepID=A0AAW2K0Q2_SESRA
MAGWSAENATNAYLRAMKMAKRAKEPDSAEFISALVAGNNARLIVVACADAADSTALALVAAAHQTGGRVVCIVSGANELQLSKETMSESADDIEFVIGNAENLVANGVVELPGFDAHLLPIGDGLLVSRVAVKAENGRCGGGAGKIRSRWVVKVDKYTGEEHVFRVRINSQGN